MLWATAAPAAQGVSLMTRRLWMALLLALVGLLAACNEDSSAFNTAPTSSPTSPAVTFESDEETYRALVTQVMNRVGELTRLLSTIGTQLSAAPEAAPLAEEVVTATEGSLELIREQLAAVNPLSNYEEAHQGLLDALSLYTQAASALLPDPKTQAADFWRFQEFMEQGGKNFHAAAAAFDEARRSSSVSFGP